MRWVRSVSEDLLTLSRVGNGKENLGPVRVNIYYGILRVRTFDVRKRLVMVKIERPSDEE